MLDKTRQRIWLRVFLAALSGTAAGEYLPQDMVNAAAKIADLAVVEYAKRFP